MVKINIFKILFICPFILLIFSLTSYGQVPTSTLVNETRLYEGSGNSSVVFNFTGTRVTMDFNRYPVHTFESQSDADSADVVLVYNASNTTGYLLKLVIDDEGPEFGNPAANDRILKVDCQTNARTQLCTGGCGGFNFDLFQNFTIKFYPNNNTFDILIGQSSTVRVSGNVCTNATLVGNIILAVEAFSGSGTGYKVKNNVVTAENRPPIFLGNISNFTFSEDTSLGFNISGNFTDPDADSLTFGFADLENITITINQSTGIVNITPPQNFFGLRFVRFLANDSKNITFSNNISINVTPVNDIPTISNVMLNNTDFLNRTNGTLVVGWTFNDIDNDAQQGNETIWYINGTENQSLRNLTIILPGNTTKTQNWTFSVRVFDGTNFSIFANSTFLIIPNSIPIHAAPIITSNDEHNRRNGTLTCNNQSTTDLDNDVITNFIRWYKNNVLVDTALDSLTLNVGNYSKNDNITCEITPNDGTVNGTSSNSTNFTILNAAPLLNNSVQNKTWDEDTSTTINLSSSFVDIDNDNLTYNHTSVSNIGVSINNDTGIATLNPDVNFNGVRDVLFFALDGINLTSSNNVTLTVNDVPEPSPPSSPSTTGGGGGGGGALAGGKYICDLDWECEEWSECIDGKEKRKCKLVQVPNFISLEKCPQHKIPEQEKSCVVEVEKESCYDYIQNQGETGIDCGGPCGPCFTVEQVKKEEPVPPIIGRVVTDVPGTGNIYLVLMIILLALALLFYIKFSHKRIFREKDRLSEEEMKKLNEMLSYTMFKK